MPREHAAPTASPLAPLVAVQGDGHVPLSLLRRTCRTILDHYPLRCEVRRDAALPRSAWRPKRRQLDARAVLEHMFRARHPEAVIELRVTVQDMFEGNRPYVFGLASLTDRVAVISLARIEDGPERLRQRLARLVLHEVGHALGLPHHDRRDCVMRQDATPSSLDTAPEGPCLICHGEISQQASILSRPGQAVLDRVRGHLVRGEVTLARLHFVQSLWHTTMDGPMLNEVALAFMQSGQLDEAVGVWRYAVRRAPGYTRAHVNLGLALQMRGQPGDVQQAIAHLETALEHDADLTHVHRELQTLRTRASASAQGPDAN